MNIKRVDKEVGDSIWVGPDLDWYQSKDDSRDSGIYYLYYLIVDNSKSKVLDLRI